MGELERIMIELSNNSVLTRQTAAMLESKLGDQEQRELLTWLRHSRSQVGSKIHSAEKKWRC